MPRKKKQTKIDDWRPTGESLFERVTGIGYTRGTQKLTGRGTPAGVFKKGPFTLGR